jgi:N-acyl-D-aspartate/D-glutamate deacylase
MAALVRGAMEAGAVGFATSTNEPHNGENGIPMPSRLADDRELRALVNAMGEGGRGTFMLTRGTKTSIEYLESLAADCRRPVVIAAMFHSNVDPDGVFRAFAAINAARGRGRRLVAQTSCCALSMDFTFREPYPMEGMAAWKPAMEAHGEALRALYRDRGFRDAVRRELESRSGGGVFKGEWHRMQVATAASPARRELEGRTIEELARAAGVHPLDYTLDLALAEDLRTEFVAELAHNDEPAVARLLLDPDANISLSDAGAHLTFLCDAGFGLHLLGHWSRDRGVMPLPEAVRRLTAQPAAIFGIADRGRLAPGLAADLMLFDPATVGRGPKRKIHDLPAGAPRFVTPATGLHGVWVNGRRIVDAGGLRGDAPRAGRVLREFAA